MTGYQVGAALHALQEFGIYFSMYESVYFSFLY